MKVLSVLTAGALIVASGALAQEVETGETLYGQYCATCHGIDATGGGPMSPVLVLQPPDLTQLNARNDGVFPVTRVVMRIDGRDPLVSHGSPMPVYGPFFESDLAVPLKAETGQPILTSPEIINLVSFLESIQQ